MGLFKIGVSGPQAAAVAGEGRRGGDGAEACPIEIVRALVGVRLFAGCRIDEIRCLDVDCIERDEGRDDKTGETFPICSLRVPQNKTPDRSPDRSTRSSGT